MVKRKYHESNANLRLLERIIELKSEHVAWGYRRIWAYLKFRENLVVNHKRIYRLMKQNNLLVPKNLKLKAKRSSKTSKPKTLEPNKYWGTDMTKVMISSFGWCYIHVVIDWGSKKIIGCHLDDKSRTREWVAALDEALNQQFPNGIRSSQKKPSLISDHGSQPTSKGFMNYCKSLKINQIFASYGNPKGNADTERVMRTIKEDLIWPREFASFNELEKSLREWVKNYNEDYPHSSLDYMTPYEYERWYFAKANAV